MKKWFTDKIKRRRTAAILIAQVVIVLVVTSASMAQTSNGSMLDTKITLNLKDVPLEKALKEIEKVAKLKFAYSEEQLDLKQQLNINVESQSLNVLLNTLFAPLQIKYKVYEKERRITLKKQANDSGGDSNDGGDKLSTITGKVTDAALGQAIAGVNVIIKGTASGTTTDSEGKYSLLANDGDKLVFSFIGYTTFEAQVNNRSLIDVVLTEDNKKLNEVTVNAGYWDVDSKEQTGNISRVTAKQIAAQPLVNPLQSLQGRIPGVQVSQISGNPGDGLNIQIRGVNSIRGTGANDPLYVIDGVPFSSSTLYLVGGAITRGPSPLSSMNPSDIESIDVLKDADATAIYGSRGANGVVLITTKKGKSGKTQGDFNLSTGIGTMGRQMDMLNTSQYVQMRKEAFRNDGVTPTISNAPDLLLWDTTRYTNWQKVLLSGTAHITNAQGNVSGGNLNTQFLIGGGFYKQTTIFPGDFGYQKGSINYNISHTSQDKKFSVNLSGNFAIDKNNLPTADLAGLTFSLSPNTPAVYDQTGNLNWENSTWSNPYGDMRKKYTTSSRNLITNLNLGYSILPGLKLKANLGYNYLNTDEKSITPIASQNPAFNPLGFSILSKGSVSTWIAEPQIEYQKNIGEGKLTALVGLTFQQTVRERQAFIASGFTNDTQLENIAAATSVTPYGGDYSEYKYNAFFGRINYNWKEKYIMNFTARRDGSSRFGPNNRFSNFGAIGAAWIFSNENFVKQLLPSVSFGKIRGSMGITGSDQIGDYQYLDTYSSTTYPYQGGKGLIPTRLLNPYFGWEENKKLEAGLDVGLFHDKLFFSASYYHNRSSNQLVGYSLPATTGFTSIQSNLPATIQNTGLELVLTNTNIQKYEFSWKTSVNVTFPKNRLISYPNIEGSSYSNTYQVDKSLFIQKKYRSTGVDPATGLYTFQDIDNNGVLSTTLDTQFLKERSTQFLGGFKIP